jgi:hypothetical protein
VDVFCLPDVLALFLAYQQKAVFFNDLSNVRFGKNNG